MVSIVPLVRHTGYADNISPSLSSAASFVGIFRERTIFPLVRGTVGGRYRDGGLPVRGDALVRRKVWKVPNVCNVYKVEKVQTL